MTKTTATMTARTPEDVLAAVPLVLGFVPEESVVMLTFGAEHPFHARLDLPRRRGGRRRRGPVGPACVTASRRCSSCCTPPTRPGAVVRARSLVRAFAGAASRSSTCCAATAAAGSRAARPDRRRVGRHAYDVTGHLFTAQSVAAGRVTRSSRAELAASVAADLSRVGRRRGAARSSVPDAPPDLAWVRAGGPIEAGVDPPDPATAGPAAAALRDPTVRDAVLDAVDREAAERLLPLWSALVRAAPTDLLAPVASVLAFAAWLAGDGALAWCALERAAEGDRPARWPTWSPRRSSRPCRRRRSGASGGRRSTATAQGRSSALGSGMGEDVDAQEFSRADRTRYREKVHRCLDTFARMLSEHQFDTDDPMTGLEVELNLVDEHGDPALKNAEALAAIADPAFQTELGQFNIEINVPPAKLREGGLATFEANLRRSLNDAEAKSSRSAPTW